MLGKIEYGEHIDNMEKMLVKGGNEETGGKTKETAGTAMVRGDDDFFWMVCCCVVQALGAQRKLRTQEVEGARCDRSGEKQDLVKDITVK